jgi:hypothetical protein
MCSVLPPVQLDRPHTHTHTKVGSGKVWERRVKMTGQQPLSAPLGSQQRKGRRFRGDQNVCATQTCISGRCALTLMVTRIYYNNGERQLARYGGTSVRSRAEDPVWRGVLHCLPWSSSASGTEVFIRNAFESVRRALTRTGLFMEIGAAAAIALPEPQPARARRQAPLLVCGFYVPVGRVRGICEAYDDSGDLDHESPCRAVIAREWVTEPSISGSADRTAGQQHCFPVPNADLAEACNTSSAELKVQEACVGSTTTVGSTCELDLVLVT